MIPPLKWDSDHWLVRLLDQTALPAEEVWLDVRTPDEMAEAIRLLRVRGAPAIGIAAAYGVVLAVDPDADESEAAIQALEAADLLQSTRPTAVNLFYALERMRRVVEQADPHGKPPLRMRLLDEARRIEREDLNAGIKLGEHGLSLLRDGMTVLTHCHAGGIATSGYGTALAPLVMSSERGVHLRAFVDETRPLLQGSRITAWELGRAGVPATLITDSMAGHVMRQGKVDAVFVGADRIAANGDVANKIGTYSLAVLANAHDVPFYVSAPLSTFDLDTPNGEAIEIEERDPREVTHGFGRQTAPDGIQVYNPAFDVTPARLVTAFVTEAGVIRPPYEEQLRRLLTDGTRPKSNRAPSPSESLAPSTDD
ncbi:MAG TPA: S-methyl-5-thioribose-1-phosphate isomerase [Rhodothermales bacterium]